jgi:hypothetical protein
MRLIFSILFLFNMFIANTQSISYICGSGNKTLSVVASDSLSTVYYTWTSPSGTSVSGNYVNTNEAGIWSWFAIDSFGCTRSGNHTLVIEPEPSATILADTVCVNESQIISVEGVSSGYCYDWDFGEDATPTTSNLAVNSVSYSSEGTKTVTLTITREFIGFSGGCSGTCTWDFDLDIEITECDVTLIATCNVP